MPVDGAGFATFDTALGRCVIVWRGGLVIGAAFPEASEAALRRGVQRRFPGAKEGAPTAPIGTAIAAVRRLLSGGEEDCGRIACDLAALAEFERRVLDVTRAIPRGETRTYGEVAAILGAPGAARAVGAALGRNPIPIIIPCHRVLAARGAPGGFSAPGGVSTKMRLLQIEGAGRNDGGLFGDLPLAVRPAS